MTHWTLPFWSAWDLHGGRTDRFDEIYRVGIRGGRALDTFQCDSAQAAGSGAFLRKGYFIPQEMGFCACSRWEGPGRPRKEGQS